MATVPGRFAHARTWRTLGLALGAVLLGVGAGVAAAAGNPFVPLAALVALLPVPWLLTRPQWDLWFVAAVIVLLPFGTLPVKLGFTPTFLEAGLLLLAVVSLYAQARAVDPAWRGWVRTPLDGFMLLFLGMILFAFVLGLARDSSTEIIHNFIKLVLAISLFFLAGQVLRSAEAIGRLVRLLVVTGGVAALVGLILWRLPQATATRLLQALRPVGYPTDGVLRFVEAGPGTGQERAIGTSVDPNSFAGLLVVLVAVTLSQVLGRRPCLPRPLLAAILVAESAALVLTQSRTALLTVLAVAALVGVLRYRRILLVLLAGGGVVAALGLGGSYLARLQSGLALQDQAQLMRLAEFQNAGAIIARYPYFGVGFGTAGELDLTTGVSSLYLTVAERAGLIGLAAFLLLMLVFFLHVGPWLSGRRLPATPDADILDAALLGASTGVVGALGVSLADHYFFNIEQAHLAALLSLCLAVGLAARRLLVAQAETARIVSGQEATHA